MCSLSAIKRARDFRFYLSQLATLYVWYTNSSGKWYNILNVLFVTGVGVILSHSGTLHVGGHKFFSALEFLRKFLCFFFLAKKTMTKLINHAIRTI